MSEPSTDPSQAHVSSEDVSEDETLIIGMALEKSQASPVRDEFGADEEYVRKLDSDDPR